jgi:hypothetical protein
MLLYILDSFYLISQDVYDNLFIENRGTKQTVSVYAKFYMTVAANDATLIKRFEGGAGLPRSVFDRQRPVAFHSNVFTNNHNDVSKNAGISFTEKQCTEMKIAQLHSTLIIDSATEDIEIRNITMQGNTCGWASCGLLVYKPKGDFWVILKDSKFYDNGKGAGFVS